MRADDVDEPLNGDFFGPANHVGQRGLDHPHIQRAARDFRVGDHLGEHAFQFADVVAHLVGDKGQDLVGHGNAALLRLRLQNRRPRLDVRHLDVGHQAPFKAGLQPLLQGDHRLRRPVAGKHQLLAAAVQIVEGVEHLFLGAFLAGNELDIVDQQHVRRAILFAELGHVLRADRLDELVGEGLGGDITDGAPLLQAVVPDGMQEVGLAQANAAVNKERIIMAAGVLRDGDGGRVSQAIAGTDDERVEDVMAAQISLDRLSSVSGELDPSLVGGRVIRMAIGQAVHRPIIVTFIIVNAVHDIAQRHVAANNAAQRAIDRVVQPVLQPIFGIRIAHADHIFVILNREQSRIFEPRIERGLCHL